MSSTWIMRLAGTLGLVLAGSPALAQSGPFGATDLASAQRGYGVYAQVCSACHSLKQMTFADLGGLGFNPAEVRALAQARMVIDGTDASGHPLRRPGRPGDHLPSPFASDAAAMAANHGALPPDFSRLALTRSGGAPRIASLLTGYRDPPPGVVVPPGSFYNIGMHSRRIAMPPPLAEGVVSYADGTRATVPQMAHDVATFLDWAAHPHQAERRRVGVGVVLYLALLAGLFLLLKRRVWSNDERKS